MLVLFKMAVGLLANSIAIILDAVNNLSDVLSSSITIVGTKLASKAPDKKHPYGHGRIEYITSVIISVIVLLAGFTSIKESIEKIINPVKTNYTIYTIIIISAAIITKFILGRYVKGVGKKNQFAVARSLRFRRFIRRYTLLRHLSRRYNKYDMGLTARGYLRRAYIRYHH